MRSGAFKRAQGGQDRLHRWAAFLAVAITGLAALGCGVPFWTGQHRPPQGRSLLFVYRGAGCRGRDALPVFERFIGRKVDGVVDFLDYSAGEPQLIDEARWALACWRGSDRRLAIAVPLLVRQDPFQGLQRLAAGRYDDRFRRLANLLVADGFADAYVRLGWEFNGSWYPWRAKDAPELWVQGYRRAVLAMRSVPGANFSFVWNPNLGVGEVAPTKAYPGDDVVDLIGVDVYNQAWGIGTRAPRLRWAILYLKPWGLAEVENFAHRHRKPIALPEWGTGDRPDGHGGGDDPAFVRHMVPIVHEAEFSGYWDYKAPDYDAELSSGRYPRAASAFRRAFGTPRGSGSGF